MKDGDAIVGFDVNKPDCGYFYDDPAALAKYYSSSSTEPGHDQPAKKFVKTFSPCDAFTQAWGLERAYC